MRALWPAHVVLPLLLWTCAGAAAQGRVVEAGTHHLRSGSRAEWSEEGTHAHPRALALEFTATRNAQEATLSLRQEDVKRGWRLVLNDSTLGTLHQDENPILAYWRVPAGLLVSGTNRLRVEPLDTIGDDVRVGRIELHDRSLDAVLSAASVEVEVVDAASGERLPARVTIVDGDGFLHTVLAAPGGALAVRPGFVYTSSGVASFALPAGSYRLFAGRGFEYGVDSATLVLRPGDRARRRLAIRREVPTEGWVASDTHVHTLTFSGHGDATLEERAVTLAGEGVELPVLTDHNVHVDLDPAARAMGVRDLFTPVVGNEVTTAVGHFNAFPVPAGRPPPESTARSWEALDAAIRATGAPIVVLNHARDVHLGFRPFGTERHVAVAGVDLEGWTLGANAMEIMNSGSQQTEPLRLFHDWLAMLNRGHLLAPVGSSDSHDVARYVVGQSRTYVRAPDGEPGNVDVAAAVESFRAGAVMVSFGLLAELTVAGRYGPGELVPAGDSLEVRVRVLGPAWTRADRVTLFANGAPVRGQRVVDEGAAGVKWTATWRLPRTAHDLHLVALAEGPDGKLPFWPIAKPYQPASPEVRARLLGASGAVWVDGDGDGRRTPAREYASRLAAASADPTALVRALAPYDHAVAIQAAALLAERGTPPDDPALVDALRGAAPSTASGFAAFTEDWLASRRARSAPAP